ncbi:MAG: glycosyltransferase [Desulfomonilia bacterium]
MMHSPTLYVLIPVFNESANVDTLCQGLLSLRKLVDGEFSTRYIIVDDGSSDDTVPRFHRNNLGSSLVILRHGRNQGPGAAFRTAFSYLFHLLQDDDCVLTMEGDNTSQLDILSSMFEMMHQGADVVLASPYAPGGGMAHVEWHRLFLSHAANLLARSIFGLRGIHTISSFYRLHRGSVIKKLQRCYGERIVESTGFEYAAEMLVKLACVEARIVEVPILIDFSVRRGKTKMRIFRTISGYLRLFARSKYYKDMRKGDLFFEN